MTGPAYFYKMDASKEAIPLKNFYYSPKKIK